MCIIDKSYVAGTTAIDKNSDINFKYLLLSHVTCFHVAERSISLGLKNHSESDIETLHLILNDFLRFVLN